MLRNAANNGFTVANPEINVGANPQRMVAADFNRDDRPDLAVTSSATNTIRVLIGQGNGTFSVEPPVTVGAGPIGIASGDFNRDGTPDSPSRTTPPRR